MHRLLNAHAQLLLPNLNKSTLRRIQTTTTILQLQEMIMPAADLQIQIYWRVQQKWMTIGGVAAILRLASGNIHQKWSNVEFAATNINVMLSTTMAGAIGMIAGVHCQLKNGMKSVMKLWDNLFPKFQHFVDLHGMDSKSAMELIKDKIELYREL